jgi:WD40 repeat protein
MKAWTRLLLSVGLLVAGPRTPAAEIKPLRTFRQRQFDVQCVAVSPDGKRLATGGGDTRGGELHLWDISTGRELGEFAGYTNTLTALAFSPDGKRLVSGGIAHEVIVWDVATRGQVRTLQAKQNYGWVHVLAFGPDGTRLAGAGPRDVQLWDVAGGREVRSFSREVSAYSTAFSHDLKTLASPNYQEIDLWDMATGKLRAVLSEHRGRVGCVAFSGDDNLLASASSVNLGDFRYRGQVKLWDVATGKERATLRGRFHYIIALALRPDGKTIALLHARDVHGDVTFKLLDVASGRELASRTWSNRVFPALAFTPDGRLFLAENPGSNKATLLEVVSEHGGRQANTARHRP